MTVPSFPMAVTIDPKRPLVILWMDGSPFALSTQASLILEGMLRDARQTVEREAADGLADKVARMEGEG